MMAELFRRGPFRSLETSLPLNGRRLQARWEFSITYGAAVHRGRRYRSSRFRKRINIPSVGTVSGHWVSFTRPELRVRQRHPRASYQQIEIDDRELPTQ